MATGVLVICLGSATRLSEYVMDSPKRYRARVHLGITTDTYDADGTITQTRDCAHLQRADVETALRQFTGDIQQIPPMYSAIKQGGRKLYDLARAGEMVEREARSVRIDSLTLSHWQTPEFTLEVSCSAGTYIRSLAHDLGELLGVGAHLTALTRLASGVFQLDEAVSLDRLLETGDWQSYLITPQRALADRPAVYLNTDEIERLRRGQTIPRTADDGLAFAYGPDGTLVAVVESDAGLWKPHKVFLSGD
jgi:tRNA pseudouridine55 synthase